MIAGRERRRVGKHGGSLWVPIPRDMAIRLRIEKGSDVWMAQPFSDVITCTRGELGIGSPGDGVYQGMIAAVADGSAGDLRARLGGFPPVAATDCEFCRERGAIFVYPSLALCAPCERELVAAWLWRLTPLPAERDVDRS